ncbi:MAG: diguanylate cyclase [Elusimicrobia bacterium]|nr:diguanylate cyclase [Elusimicrobiota bacterium]
MSNNSLLQPQDPEAPRVHLSSDFIRVKEYLEAIVASTADAICTTDTEGRILYFSPGAEKMTGYGSKEVVGRYAYEYYLGGRREADRIMKKLKKDEGLQNHEMVLKSKEGRRIHVSMSASLLKDRRGQIIGTLGISKDITHRVELENRLRELSITDNLTALYNQRYFQEQLSQEVRRARRQGYQLSLILMDLDGFKKVNDEKGHLEGDRLLKSFSAILLGHIRREMDTAYRYGGDEFVILLPGLGKELAEKVAQRIADAAAQKKDPCPVFFSFGVTTLAKSENPLEFLNKADRRMFQMKAQRKNPHQKRANPRVR